MTTRSRSLRIGIVAESFVPSVNGVARSVERVVHHLRGRGHECLVVAPGPGPGRYGDVAVVRVPSVPLLLCRDFPLAIPTPRVRRALEDFRADVVHLASPTVLGAAGASVAVRLDLPVVAVFQTDLAGSRPSTDCPLRPSRSGAGCAGSTARRTARWPRRARR